GGVYVHDKIFMRPPWVLNAGIRYDHSRVEVERSRDWFATPVEDGEAFILRSPEADLAFNFVSWSMGANYHRERSFFKVNIGKGFRMPQPKELAANGMNYHMYRYEEGNIDLSPEVSWQLDAVLGVEQNRLEMEMNPFVTWFPNYIFLGPESGYHQGLQRFKYRDNEVFRAGGELMLKYRLSDKIESGIESEYVYSRQMSGDKKGFTLPFSLPWTTDFSLEYDHLSFLFFDRLSLKGEYRLVAEQNDIVPPEKKTPGYGLTSFLASGQRQLDKTKFTWNLQARNLFNVRYLDHTSFYRLIEAPGPGRNFILSMNVLF
ncbi:MAG: TonB-dependent receptor domain-containing protein, partial [Bacteroidota bacterium]